ncbi:MAG TPA: purine-nucleoside phosphorylase [Anaerolineaceae bacterium]|jgi:purine-nucleoside phosphorylase|nr:purine-nucleoside phosphorylase [Anaerolineales bacterium]HOG58009.1 purine-nucleoside phosphorylase [Anaerolineaceae bacterium]HOR83853.1 purine-nucleoside phosphorylase [Anaerolineaceae bacterium]HOT53592.1 purine-nucleoside phosphorylase [Anaerolineaceae bacterium]HPL42623.1 purine-nucleoside phosphorylase [Anaerolineaceae bacterium]
MSDIITMQEIDTAAAVVRGRISIQPKIALILGSGLGPLADEVESPAIIPTSEIPHWPVSTVQGHSGRLVIGRLMGKAILVLQGRAHYYEGYSMSRIGLPVRVMQRLGIRTVVLTNAAGGINPDYSAGDLMLITDHLSLLPMTGPNPLRGPNLDEFGPRFPDMSQVYDQELIALAQKVSDEANLNVRRGIYAGLSGPSFETPADCRFLRLAGADAVGMSTVPEAIVARHGGQRVLGISGISNKIDLNGTNIASHEEVLEAGKVIVPKLTTIIKGVLASL